MEWGHKKAVIFAITIGLGILFFLFYGPLRPYLFPPIRSFLLIHIRFLFDIMFYTFLISCAILVALLVLLERERAKTRFESPHYKSAVVASDYYKGIKKVDYYRAIKHYLSRYRLETLEDDQAPIETVPVQKKKLFRKWKLFSRPDNLREKRRKSFTNEEKMILDSPDMVEAPITDGVFRTYYKNGQIEQEAHYRNGKLHGTFVRFYEDGHVNQEKHYTDGELDGTFRAFDEFGVPFFEMYFKKGVKDGIEKIYYPTGVVQYIDTYRNGEKISRKTYDESGNLKFDYNYIEGREELSHSETKNKQRGGENG